MIDIAPNLCSEQFDKDWKEVLKKAEQAGMKAMILTSTDKKSYEKNLFIIENNPTNIQLKTTYGLHPHHAQHHSGIFENLKQAVVVGRFDKKKFGLSNSLILGEDGGLLLLLNRLTEEQQNEMIKLHIVTEDYLKDKIIKGAEK